jgi:ribokinase
VSETDIDLCVVGDFAWDVLIRTNNELLRGGDTFGEVMLMPGGSAANVAAWAARCGLPTHFIGKIGRDRMGQLALEDLASENVVGHLVESDAHTTGSVAVFVDHTGERSMVTGVGADHLLLPEHLPLEMIGAARHLHLTGWSLFGDPPRAAALAGAEAARAAGATVSFDPSAHQLITVMGVDAFVATTRALEPAVVFPNRDEGAVLTGETRPAAIAGALARLYGGALVVLKLDAEGALVWRDGVGALVPAIDAVATDTTGAGDAFAGAFLARWLAGDDPAAAATFAVRVAAWVVARAGARPAGWGA